MKTQTKTHLLPKQTLASILLLLLFMSSPNLLLPQQASLEEKVRIECIINKYVENSNFKYCSQKTKDSLVLAVRDAMLTSWTQTITASKTERDMNSYIDNHLKTSTLTCIARNKPADHGTWTDSQKQSVKDFVSVFLKIGLTNEDVDAFTKRVTNYNDYKVRTNEWAEKNETKAELYKYIFNKDPKEEELLILTRAIPVLKKESQFTGTWRRKKKIIAIDDEGYSITNLKGNDATAEYFNKSFSLRKRVDIQRCFKRRIVSISPDRMTLRFMGFKRVYKKTSNEINGMQISNSDNRENWIYFKNYTNWQKAIITEHWVQYFKEDIHQKLDSTIPMFPIKMDSYGNIYPPQPVLAQIGNNGFEDSKLKDNNMFRFSLYNIFLNNKDQVQKNISTMSEKEKKLYSEFLSIANKNKKHRDNKDEFNQKWQQNQADDLVVNLKARLAKLKKKQILFFVHGYNVPYSLANIQAIELVKLLGKNKIDTSKFLLVPIFWSSNDAKDLNLQSEETFSTLNEIRPDNGFKFMNYSNRAYFASIAFRKILNVLKNDTDLKVLVFSHSLGSTLATSAVINTYSKLDYNSRLKSKINAKWSNRKIKTYKRKEPVNYYLVKGWKETELPKRKVSFFMSAAAMPGQTTFKDLRPDLESFYKFYSTVNQRDEMLTKSSIPLPGIKATNTSATSLGCDYKGEATATQNLFHDRTHFVLPDKETYNQDHDILTYMRQPEYVSFVIKFFSENQ